MSDDLNALLAEIRAFRDAREWQQFHTPRQLTAALAIEAAELQEVLLWQTDADVHAALERNGHVVGRLREELGDVLIYALLLADQLGADPAEVVRQKLTVNAGKYPVAQAKGRAMKYDVLPPSM